MLLPLRGDSEAIPEMNQDKLKYFWNKRLLRRSTPRNDICMCIGFYETLYHNNEKQRDILGDLLLEMINVLFCPKVCIIYKKFLYKILDLYF